MKKIITIILSLIALMLMPLSAFAAVDAYQDILCASHKDSQDTSAVHVPATTLTTYVYENVDFGDKTPRSFTLNYAFEGNYGGKVEVSIDSTVVAELTTTDTGNWDKTYSPMTVGIKNITLTPGEHTVSLRIVERKDTVGNIASFKFGYEPYDYVDIEKPEIQLRSQMYGSAAATTIAGTRRAGATANVTVRLERDPAKAALLLAEYNSDGTMLKLHKDEKTLQFDGNTEAFTVSPSRVQTGLASLGAYLWDEDMNILETGAYKTDDTEYAPQSGNAQTLTISNISGKVTVSGAETENECVAMVVVPSSAQNGDLFANAVQVFEIPVVNGTYSYTFRMNSTLATGEYTVIAVGSEKETKSFKYTDPAEIYTFLSSLDGESDSAALIQLLGNNASVLETEDIYSSLASFDANLIAAAVNEVFDQNPLSQTGDYTLWINKLSEKITPLAVNGMLKKSDSGEVAELLEEYKDILGISASANYKLFSESKQENAKVLKKNINAATTLQQLPAIFNTSAAIGYMNTQTVWGGIDTVFTKYYTDLGLNISTYRQLNNTTKAEICRTFISQGFENKEEIANKLEELVEKYATEDNMRTSNHPIKEITAGADIYTYQVLVPKPEEYVAEVVKSFADLDGVLWAKQSILAMHSRGIVNGKSETEFAPMDSITREEFAAIVVRAFGLGEASADSLGFADVNKSAWYAPFVASAYNNGIVKGRSADWFGTGDKITREDIAVMLERAVSAAGMSIIPVEREKAFVDTADFGDYSYDTVIRLARAEIINGTGADMFSPKKNATRAEAVVMLDRLLNNIR